MQWGFHSGALRLLLGCIAGRAVTVEWPACMAVAVGWLCLTQIAGCVMEVIPLARGAVGPLVQLLCFVLASLPNFRHLTIIRVPKRNGRGKKMDTARARPTCRNPRKNPHGGPVDTSMFVAWLDSG